MFYAKSKKYMLSKEEIEEIRKAYLQFKTASEQYLSAREKEKLDQALHNIENQSEEPQKTLEEHLKETVQCAEDFFDKYGKYFKETEKREIIFACKVHDWGKVNILFQKKIGNLKYAYKEIPGDIKEVPHGFLSAYSISKEEYKRETGDTELKDFNSFLTAVFFHHIREDEFTIDEIKLFFRQYYVQEFNDFIGKENTFQGNGARFLYRNNGNNSFAKKNWDPWIRYIIIKGLLNKFDYSVSAGAMKAEINPDLDNKKLKRAIESKIPMLRSAQEFMRYHTNRSVILVAGTGSGKTEAALLWLNGEKGFYTLPLKVSSNAIYQRIKKIYGYKDAAILHSDSLLSYLNEDDPEGYEKFARARSLSFPLTVCTVDQIFKFAYKAFGTEILAATLKYSKVIIDEIQAYSPQLIAMLLYSLKIIKDLNGKYAIITATFPPVLQHFMKKYDLVEEGGEKGYIKWEEAKEDPASYDKKRHWFQVIQSFDYDRIIEQGRKRKILIVCNTVKKAQKVYQELKEYADEAGSMGKGSIHLLHSLYINKHRTLLERAIMAFSKDEKEAGIWIATQIVEVSLDIDFDVLYTELCPCDSLLQRMGRCNRQARYEPKEANIFICADEEAQRGNWIYDRDIVERSFQFLEEYENKLFTEKMKIEYVDKVYDPDKIQNTTYYKAIDEWLAHFENITPGEYKLNEVNKKFRMINSVSVIPDEIYQKNVDFIEGGLAFAHTPNIGNEMKALINFKLRELTLSINIHSGGDKKWLEGQIPIPEAKTYRNCRKKETSGIYRCKYGYEFDEKMLSGLGLIKSRENDTIEDHIL